MNYTVRLSVGVACGPVARMLPTYVCMYVHTYLVGTKYMYRITKHLSPLDLESERRVRVRPLKIAMSRICLLYSGRGNMLTCKWQVGG